MQTNNLIDIILSSTTLTGNNPQKQRKIIESAINLFGEKGYANTSTSEIARSSGIAEGTLFRYYKTKEALLLSIINAFKQSVIPKISKEVVNLMKLQVFISLEQALTFLLRNRLEFIRENQKIFKVFIKEIYYKDALRYELLPQINDNELQTFANNLVNTAKANGEINDIPNHIIFRNAGIIAVSYFVARFTVLPQELYLDDDSEINLLVSHIINGLR